MFRLFHVQFSILVNVLSGTHLETVSTECALFFHYRRNARAPKNMEYTHLRRFKFQNNLCFDVICAVILSADMKSDAWSFYFESIPMSIVRNSRFTLCLNFAKLRFDANSKFCIFLLYYSFLLTVMYTRCLCIKIIARDSVPLAHFTSFM